MDIRNAILSNGQVYKSEQRIDPRKYRLMNLALTPGRNLDRFIKHVFCVLSEEKEMITGNLDMLTKNTNAN